MKTDAKHDKDEEAILEDDSDQGELMLWHLRLRHVFFYKLRAMESLVMPPKRLLKVKISKCSSCMCGLITRKGWMSRGIIGQLKAMPEDFPEDCACIDAMESRTPGLVAHLKARLI